jgi:hypothetical protein
VSRRVFIPSLKRCGSVEPNPTCAGSSPYRSHRSNSPAGEVRSQGRPVRAAMEWPGDDTSGGITIRPGVCVRIRTRLKRWGWETNLSLWGGRVSTEDIPGAWWGRLEKTVRKPDRRGPTSFCCRETTDKPYYKALSERCGDAVESAERSLALAPKGLQRVRRRSAVFQGPKGHTDDRGWTSRMARVQLAHG